MEEERLRIAVQKSGRLSEGSFDLLKACGLTISKGRDKLYARVSQMPIDLLMVRDDDIPGFVADGVCDVGIVGENVFKEHALTEELGADVEVVERLGFSRCRLCLAVPNAETYDGPQDLSGKRIATSYPGLVNQFLKQEGVDARTVMMQGSVEVAPRLKVADAIVDIVSTGATLEANGLRMVQTILESEALLLRRPGAFSPQKQKIFNALAMRINGVLQSRDSKYVMMNAPRSALEAITEILPGADAPTVLELVGDPDRVAVHAVCRESVFWDTLERLKAAGATAILVAPIEKIMF